jgi:hypothetical protein
MLIDPQHHDYEPEGWRVEDLAWDSTSRCVILRSLQRKRNGVFRYKNFRVALDEQWVVRA